MTPTPTHLDPKADNEIAASRLIGSADPSRPVPMFRAGHGEPVLLLHGFVSSWEKWRPVLTDLVAKFDVIAPTLPGHWGGPDFAEPTTFRHAVDGVERILDDQKIDMAHIAGNSMGGAIALGLAARGRARSVIGLSPAGGWDPYGGEPDRLARFFSRVVADTRRIERRLDTVMASAVLRRLAFRNIMRRGHLMHPADAVHAARAVLGTTVADGVLNLLRSRQTVLGDDDLAAISVPVLLAWAEQDRVLPSQTCAHRLRRMVPGATYRVLPGVGHVPMWDDPRLVSRTIIDWVGAYAAPVSRPADTVPSSSDTSHVDGAAPLSAGAHG